MNRATVIMYVAVFFLLIFSVQVTGQTAYEAHLNGGNEIHLPSTTASGKVEAVLTDDTLTISGSFSNLVSPVNVDIAGGAHIHVGYAGANGPIVFGLNMQLDPDMMGGSFDPEENTFALTQEQLDALNERRYYVNIHTERYPAGEIRGQLVPAAEQVFRVNLTGNNETPPVLTSAYGALVVELNDDELILSGAFTGLSSQYTASHIHVGLAGRAGGVEIGLNATLDGGGTGGVYEAANNTYTLTEAQLQMLHERRLYVNIHSQNHPPGEIRGQLLGQADAVFQANLSGATEIPPVDSDGTGAVIAELMGNALIVTGSFAGLSSNQTSGGAHIHIGYSGQSGGVVFPLVTTPGMNSMSGTFEAEDNTFELNEERLENLVDRRYYVNVHSQNYPPGEIRGQLLGEARSYYTSRLAGLNEIVNGGPVGTAAGGGLAVERTGNRITVSGSFAGLSSDLAVNVAGGAHLHFGGPGETGGIAVGLEVTPGGDQRSGVFHAGGNTYTMETETETALVEGRLYANVHSMNFMPGEIRGQLLFDPHYFPTASAITSPADGASVMLEGDPDAEITITWSEATDPNNNALAYIWQLAADESFGMPLVNVNVGSDPAVVTTVGDLEALLDLIGIEVGDSVMVYHRAISSNGSLNNIGEPASVTIIRGIVTSVNGDAAAVPDRFALHQNYPNPFNPSTIISFDLPERSVVTLSIYDMLGREVTTLIDNEVYSAGSYSRAFHAGSIGSGIYFYKLMTESHTQIRRMLFIK